MIIRTWNIKLLDRNEVIIRSQNDDPYYKMIHGWMLTIGYGVEKDFDKGEQLLMSIFETEFSDEAKYLYAQSLFDHRDLSDVYEDKLIKKEIDILEELVIKSFAPALFQLGLKYEFSENVNIQKDFRRAVEYYRQAAKLGHIPAKKKLWTIWFESLGMRGRFFRFLGALFVAPYGIYVAIKFGMHDSRAHY